MQLLESPKNKPFDVDISGPMETGRFLRIAVDLAAAIRKMHRRGLIHKDIKPANLLVDAATGVVQLTGFDLASRLPRERQPPEPPEFIAGTLAYMAPEQTGRMNRSIDSRSDLYSVGVTLYEMLTGHLPFTASDPMEWVYCHIAKHPAPPVERGRDIPPPVSAIIMKLLAKMAEERYQTAAGVEHDLRQCLAQWEAGRLIEAFPVGKQDTPDWLRIPETLYGRAEEIGRLLAAFDRVVQNGTTELVLVSGYSGIGKSSVVNELHKVLIPPHALFASGKFDQYKRDIPYATLAQAFRSLTRMLLSKSETELADWREAIREALGPNGQLMVDVIPELALIIGEQPPVPDLPPRDARRRFQLVLRRFIGVFAKAEHPLALFLDDLQWLDSATLDLIEDVFAHEDVAHLLLIGAYRDNEVSVTHPLTRRLDTIRKSGVKVEEILLTPLGHDDVKQLVADSLRCEAERAEPLAQLIHEKTAGNPFFVIQFLSGLAEGGLLAFDYGEGRWCWDLNRIHAKGYTDNVAALMACKLNRLPTSTQKILQQLACLGNIAEIKTLSLVCGTPKKKVHAALLEAVRQEFVVRLDGAYKFVHDRVQEAAYSLIPEDRRAEAHLHIGTLLAAHTPPEKQEEAIFEITGQLNRGAALITEEKEREQLARFNLIAGKRAKASTAYASALSYLSAGAALLPEDCWERQHELAFQLELHRAECEFLTGALTDAEARLAALSTHAATMVQRAAITCLSVDLFQTLGQGSRAIEVGLNYLRQLGIACSPHPVQEDARREYERIRNHLKERTIEDVADLPLMTDPSSIATMDVLTKIIPPVLFSDVNLFSLIVSRAVNLSLAQGNSPGSCIAYACLGMIAGPQFNNYKAGFRFAQVGCKLAEQHGFERFRAGTYMIVGNVVSPWTRHVRAGRDLVRQAFEIAKSVGDLTYAGYSANNLVTNMLSAGDPLAEVQREAENSLTFAKKTRFDLAICSILASLALVRMLRGSTQKFGHFDDEQFDELEFEGQYAKRPELAAAEVKYWVRKLQARFLAGDYAEAIDASLRARTLLDSNPPQLETAEYHYYAALSRAAAFESADAAMRQQHAEALEGHWQQLQIWAENCPENFETRAALVGAEIARIEGCELDAERLYEKAIRSARDNDFVHNEALANELAARFYAARGFERIAQLYLRDARDGYWNWGAEGKVRQLEDLHPQLRPEVTPPCPASTISAPVEHLDLATIVKVSHAVSSEIVLEKLIDTLMGIALEHAGAERGVLLVPHEAGPHISAEATIDADRISVSLQDAPLNAAALPESIISYVMRTRDSVILDDAAAPSPFAGDDYLYQTQPRSVLCLPLLKQGELIAALYLENNLTPRVFTPARIKVLEVLASGAAISLENSRLYRDLKQREEKIRRLVDANIIGVLISNLDGQILEANDAFLEIVGYSHEDLAAGELRWTELTPAEWQVANKRAAAQIGATGACEVFEKEYFRKDGNRVPVLVGVAAVEGTQSENIAFVLDLTERKHAEAEARESERRYSEAQLELAHANRVATMGQLTASIAHEVSQPIMAIVANAHAGLKRLDAQSLDPEDVRQILGRIAKDGVHASEVICRIRDLIKKAPPRKEALTINEAILEVIAMAGAETSKHRVSVQTELADDLPLVRGDRVQLQQVLLNLIINAVEAMKDITEGKRELQISTSKAGSEGMLVTVQDSGPGLRPESLQHVFEAFYTTKSAGMGMGLSICRSIIEAHGGQLWATANPLHGATFHFSLPVCGLPAS